MIDLTPLDVRNKRGDFSRGFRGYDRREVDHFLELVADRLEALVKENLGLKDELGHLRERVQDKEGREEEIREALVMAQSLRREIEEQAHREAELIRNEAKAQARRIREGVEEVIRKRQRDLEELDRAKSRFVRSYRTLLERELDGLEVEESADEELDLDAIREAAAAPETHEPGGEAPSPEGASDGPGGHAQDLFSAPEAAPEAPSEPEVEPPPAAPEEEGDDQAEVKEAR